MNYLAHIFLSKENGSRQVGNFVGDFVKGKNYESYPLEIRRGMILHRQIDDFTDNHPIVKEAVAKLRGTFGRYSAIILDLYFDYILANNIQRYCKSSLPAIAYSFYRWAIIYYFFLPSKVKSFIWHFIFTNRLVKYKTKEGLRDSLQIMANFKTPHISPDDAVQYLSLHLQEIEDSFHQFFPDLITFVTEKENEIRKLKN